MKKTCSLIILLILAISSMITTGTSAQTIPKPSAPQFSIQYVDYSYDIPATNSTNAYTGQQVQNPSQHIGDIRIEGKIKNHPFTPYSSLNPPNGSISNIISFYYNVRSKGHFGTEWTNFYGYHNKDFIGQKHDGEYTNFTIYLQEFPEGSQVDYQVKALIGFEGRTYIGPYPQPVIIGEESDWSSTLTLIFTKNETASVSFASNINTTAYPPLPSPEPTPTPTIPAVSTSPSQTAKPQETNNQPAALPSLNWQEIAIIVLVLAVVILAITSIHTRRRVNEKKV